MFAGNTNSDLYLWEAGDRAGEQDFLEDLIASTDEIAYSRLNMQSAKMSQFKQSMDEIIRPGEVPTYLNNEIVCYGNGT